jgi:hypothetical protein
MQGGIHGRAREGLDPEFDFLVPPQRSTGRSLEYRRHTVLRCLTFIGGLSFTGSSITLTLTILLILHGNTVKHLTVASLLPLVSILASLLVVKQKPSGARRGWGQAVSCR